jgi:hypothetical protein
LPSRTTSGGLPQKLPRERQVWDFQFARELPERN